MKAPGRTIENSWDNRVKVKVTSSIGGRDLSLYLEARGNDKLGQVRETRETDVRG